MSDTVDTPDRDWGEKNPDAGPMVTVRNLQKYYDDDSLVDLGRDAVRAVDGVDLTIDRGETLGLVGESGCGKTTLGRTLTRLETPTAGEITARDTDVASLSGTELRSWQREAGMVFQDPEESLNDRMTVGQVVREPLDAHSEGTARDRDNRVFDLLERVGLQEEHYYRYPHQFSGGQRQRIGIARALALEPEFVVLDEPTSALDVSVQARIINLLEDLQSEMGLTYLFITHDLSVVKHIADRIAVMYLGKIIERGPTERVFDDPQHPYTASLLSAIPGSDVEGPTGTGERITLRGAPPSPRDPPPGCSFATRCPAKIRPNDTDLDPEAWAAVEGYRAVLRERARADRSFVEQVGSWLGLSVGDDVDDIRTELFDGVDLPTDVETAVEVATDDARRGDDRTAAERLRTALDSPCDRGELDDYDVGPDHVSRCLRHESAYRDTDEVLDERIDSGEIV
jgi:peptide/nickel transport system ATP-binding protein